MKLVSLCGLGTMLRKIVLLPVANKSNAIWEFSFQAGHLFDPAGRAKRAFDKLSRCRTSLDYHRI